MHFPTWVDLKGQDSVPETVHHVVCYVDPKADASWHGLVKDVQVSSELHVIMQREIVYSKI